MQIDVGIDVVVRVDIPDEEYKSWDVCDYAELCANQVIEDIKKLKYPNMKLIYSETGDIG